MPPGTQKPTLSLPRGVALVGQDMTVAMRLSEWDSDIVDSEARLANDRTSSSGRRAAVCRRYNAVADRIAACAHATDCRECLQRCIAGNVNRDVRHGAFDVRGFVGAVM